MTSAVGNIIIYVRGVESFSRPIQRAAAEANAHLKKLWRDQEGATSKFNQNNQKIVSTIQSIAKVEKDAAIQAKAYATQKMGLKDRQKNLYDESKALQKIRLDLIANGKEGTASWLKNEAAINRNSRAVKLATRQYTDLWNKAHQLKTTTAIDLGVKRETVTNLANANQGLSAFLKQIEEVEIVAAKTQTKILNFQSGIAGLQSRLQSLGLVATATFSTAIAGAFTSATKSFADYESSLRNIQSIGRQTDSEMSSLSSTFLNMSKDISKTIATPKQLAESFYEVQSAGFYGADAMNILDASTRAATAGLADQQEVAKALAMALHAYGVGTEEATHYTDVMMKAVDIGIFRFEDLTSQMGDFIAAAGMMGVPIEEVMAALTAMTKKGIPIAEAATSLNRIMMNYLKPAKKEIDLAKEYGIELSANTLKVKGFAGAMTEMLEKTKGNEDVLANLIGEVRGIRGVFALGSDGLKMYNADLEKMYAAAGTVTDVFNTQMKSLSAQLQNLKNNFTVLSISVGKALLPGLQNLVSWASNAASSLTLLDDKTKNVIIGLGALVAATGPLMLISSGFLGALNSLLSILRILNPTLLAAAISFIGVAAPVLILVAGLASLVAGIALLVNNSRKSTEKIKEMTSASKDLKEITSELERKQVEYNQALSLGNKAWIEYAKGIRDDLLKKQSDKLREIEDLQRKSRAAVLNAEAELAANRLTEAIINLANSEFTKDARTKSAAQATYDAALAEYEYAKALAASANVLSTVNNQLLAHQAAIAASNLPKQNVGVEKPGWSNPFTKNLSKGLSEISPVAKNANDEINGLLDKYKELNSVVPELSDIGVTEFPLQFSGDALKSLDEYIDKMSKINGVSPELIAKLKDIRLELLNDYGDSFRDVYDQIANGDFLSALETLKNDFMGTDTSIEDFINNIDSLSPYLQEMALELLNTDEVLNMLRDDARSPIQIRIELLTQGLDKIDDLLLGLSGTTLKTDKILSMQSQWASEYKALINDLEKNKITGLAKDLEIERFWNSKESLIDGFTEIGKSAGSTSKTIEDKFATAAGKIQGYFSKGIDFSKGLGELTPGGKEGVMAPGANGAFEALYRIQDIAMSKTRGKGADTDKWAAMYGLTPEAATEIVKKFQMGIFDADVMKYVDTEAMINTAKLEMMAEQSQKALAEKLAKQSGLSNEIFMGLFGLNQKNEQGQVVLPTVDLTKFRTQIADDAAKLPPDATVMKSLFGATEGAVGSVVEESLGLFLTQFDVGKEKKNQYLEERGAALWDGVGVGIINKAKSDGRLYEAVYAMVERALLEG